MTSPEYEEAQRADPWVGVPVYRSPSVLAQLEYPELSEATLMSPGYYDPCCPCWGECGYHQARCQSVPKAGRRRCTMCEAS